MKNLFAAIAAFQFECPILVKETKASDRNYKYVELPKLIEIIKPLLQKHKLGYTQMGAGKSIKTVIFHTETGEFIKGKLKIPQGVKLREMNDFQVLGAAITYLRRYSLAMMLGIVEEKDTDGAGEQIRDKNQIPEGATLVAATSDKSSTEQKKKVPPAFDEVIFAGWKDSIQSQLNQGKSHDGIFTALRKEFLMITPKAEKLIRDLKAVAAQS